MHLNLQKKSKPQMIKILHGYLADKVHLSTKTPNVYFKKPALKQDNLFWMMHDKHIKISAWCLSQFSQIWNFFCVTCIFSSLKNIQFQCVSIFTFTRDLCEELEYIHETFRTKWTKKITTLRRTPKLNIYSAMM